MNKKTKSIISYIIVLVCIIISFYIMYQSANIQNGFDVIWLLPFLYGFLYFTTSLKFAIFDYLSVFILNVIMVFRYVILPLYSSITNIYFHSNALITNNIHNRTALFLMIYELLCISFLMHFLIKKLNRQKNRVLVTKDDRNKFSSFSKKYNFSIYYLAVIIGILSFILFPSVRERANFFIVDKISYSNLNAISTLGLMFAINIFKIIFIITISKQIYRIRNGHKLNKLLVYLALILCITFVASTNRTTIVVQSIVCLIILGYVNMLNKRNMILIGTVTIVIVISLTTYRYFNTGNISSMSYIFNDVNTEQINIDNLQSYFGGHHLIALSIKDKLSFQPNVESFLNEILSSINFVRQIFPLNKDSSTVLFNKNFGFYEQNSMILPSLAQGYYYFGMLGAPLLSILFCFLIYTGERKIINTDDIGIKFAFYILVAWLGFFPLQNLNIVTASVFNVFLPLYIIVFINSRFQLSAKTIKFKITSVPLRFAETE